MFSVNRLLLFIWTFLLLCFRPSIIAQSYNKVVFVIFILVTTIILARCKEKIILKLNFKEILILGIITVTVSYFLIQGMILSDAKSTVLNSCSFLFGIIPAIFFIIRVDDFKEQIVKNLINIHYVLAISQIITFLTFVLSDFELPKYLIFFNLQDIVKYTTSDLFSLSHYVVFPFTVVWSIFAVGSVEFYRTCGIYREPGMAQIFYLTALFLSFFYVDKNINVKRFVLVIGSILLFSASGFLNLLLGFLGYFLSNKLKRALSLNTVIKIGIGALILFVFAVFTLFSISKKLQVESGYERSYNIKKSFQGFNQNPIFGEGYYNSFKVGDDGLVISDAFLSFIGVANQLGSVGTILYILCWVISLYYFANKSSWFIYIPCLLTLLTSQPSYNDAFVWFLMMFDSSRFYIPKSDI